MGAMEHVFHRAWQPLTPRGVGKFAHAAIWRLMLVQVVFALLAAGSVTWCIRTAWFPVVTEAFQGLPETGELREGHLLWAGPSPVKLAEGRFLSLVVDLDHTGDSRGAAHICVELGTSSARLFSLFGYLGIPYPQNWTVAVNRPEALPWWGAWSPAILAGSFVGVMVVLMVVWAGLAFLYAAPACLVAFFSNRPLGLGGAWRMCGAAQMPGAVCMALGVILYGLGFLDPIRLLVAFGVHLVVSWLYVAVSPLTLPMVQAVGDTNPFASSGGENAATSVKHRDENPFSSGPH